MLTASTAGLAAVVPIGAAIDEAPQPAPVLDGYDALLSAAGGAR